jgi:uncharacterized spore protein YtfJ
MTNDEAGSATRRSIEEAPVEQLVERLAERIGARAGVRAVFGEPIRSGDAVVVPVARVRWGFGGGGGSSSVEQASGSGGGGGALSDPVGYLVIRDGDAQFHPIAGPWPSPAYVLAGAAAVAIVVRALTRLVR